MRVCLSCRIRPDRIYMAATGILPQGHALRHGNGMGMDGATAGMVSRDATAMDETITLAVTG